MVKGVFPTLTAESFVSVQPMPLPTPSSGPLPWKMAYKYGEPKKPTPAPIYNDYTIEGELYGKDKFIRTDVPKTRPLLIDTLSYDRTLSDTYKYVVDHATKNARDRSQWTIIDHI